MSSRAAARSVHPSGSGPARRAGPPALLVLAFALAFAPAAAGQTPLDSLGPDVFAGPAGPGAEPALFQAVSLTSYQLLTAALDADARKVTFAPWKLRERYVDVLSEVVFDVARSGGRTAFGVGASWNGMAPEGARGRRLARETAARLRPRAADEDPTAYAAWLAAEGWPDLVTVYREALLSRTAIVTGGAHFLLFDVLGGTDADLDGDGRVDEAHAIRGWDASAGVAWLAGPRTGLHGTVHLSRLRRSPEAGEPLVLHRGAALSVARTVAVLDPDYRRSRAYRTTLFVPSVALGAALEWQRCDGAAATCERAIRSRWVITPFVDFRVAPAAQFRVGPSIRRIVRFTGDDATELAAVVQYAFQLARPE